MKRWLITESEHNISYPAYYYSYEIACEKHPNAVITEYQDDMKYMEYINIIKEQSVLLDSKLRRPHQCCELYKTLVINGYAYVYLYFDPEDNKYFDYIEYQIRTPNQLIVPITRTMGNLQNFCEEYLLQFEFALYSHRFYGQPKLAKPKELKGIKQQGSASWNKQCRCQYFAKDNDVYIKHRDYFSPSYCEPEDIGTPLGYRLKKYGIDRKANEKFCYADCWGDIVLRNEAWILLKNLIPLLKVNNYNSTAKIICREQEKYHRWQQFSLDDWEFFYEQICKDLQENYLNKKEVRK